MSWLDAYGKIPQGNAEGKPSTLGPIRKTQIKLETTLSGGDKKPTNNYSGNAGWTEGFTRFSKNINPSK